MQVEQPLNLVDDSMYAALLLGITISVALHGSVMILKASAMDYSEAIGVEGLTDEECGFSPEE
jgi:hypothetical protein